MMQPDQSDLINRSTLFPLTDGNAHNLTDGFALAWIFLAALGSGLLLLNVNRLSLTILAVSIAASIIWWALSHYKRTR